MAEPVWTLDEIVTAIGGTCLGAAEAPVAGLSIDSRSLVKGDGFVAIRGPNRDGHAFVAAALDQSISAKEREARIRHTGFSANCCKAMCS